jgi:hypothetical protein
MATSSSVPGKGPITFEAGDTLKRTITISSGGSPVNLTGANIELIISPKEDAEPTVTLTIGEGLIGSDLANGEFQIKWQSGSILPPKKSSYYKVRITFPDGTIRTYLEDKITTI